MQQCVRGECFESDKLISACECEIEHPLLPYNRTLARVESLAQSLGWSVLVAPSIEDIVAKSGIIFTCLANEATIQETIEQALAVDVEGKILVDSTTVHPTVTNNLARSTAAKGAEFASMLGMPSFSAIRVKLKLNTQPVLGSPAMAIAGQLICIGSGPAAAIDTIKPYVTGVMGRQLIEFRDSEAGKAGKADMLKLIANTFILNVNEIVAEDLTFAEKTSIEPRKLQDLLDSLFGPLYSIYAQRMVDGIYLENEVSFK